MNEYSIWQAFEEQWDADNIDPPRAVIAAKDPVDAVKQFAEKHFYGDSEIAVIVKDNKTGQYFEIELVKEWDVDLFKPTTLQALCAP